MLKDYTMTPNRAGIPVWRPAQPVIGKEDEHQTALTNWARMMRTQYPALRLYHHIPNGGRLFDLMETDKKGKSNEKVHASGF